LARSDDLEYVSVLASLPSLSVFEYLVGCWKRINTAKSVLLKKVLLVSCLMTSQSPVNNYLTTMQSPVAETQRATVLLDKLRDLIISYAGLTLQEPEMFPQPIECVLQITCHLIDASLTPSLPTRQSSNVKSWFTRAALTPSLPLRSLYTSLRIHFRRSNRTDARRG
jgi:hypothetical protein